MTHDTVKGKSKKIITFRCTLYIFILLFILFGGKILVAFGIYDNLVLIIKHLWKVHWIFRINPFNILYFIVGPSIIWYIKPKDSVYKRYSLIFFAFVLSILIYILGVEYNDSLKLFEYHLCADPLDVAFEVKKTMCEQSSFSVTSSHFYKVKIPINLFIILSCSPLWGGVRLIWRIYHRKTIKQMGKQFKWKIFDDITIFLSLIWAFALIWLLDIIYYFL